MQDLVGLDYNRADLRHVPGVKPEFAEVVLSAHQDPFFKANMYANFGDVGLAIKGLVDSWRGESRTAGDFQSIEAMASFVENLSEYNHQQGVTYKHVTVMSELSHAVERRQLMAVSGVEQDLACQAASLAAHYDAVAGLLAQPGLEAGDKLRLLLLFALRYEKEGKPQVMQLSKQLAEAGLDPASLALARTLLQHCGAERRVMDLFSDRTLGSRFASLAKQHLTGLENVYTQHSPPLVGVLERLARGKLPEADYPRIDRAAASVPALQPSAQKPPRLVVVFVVGGATYEEAKAVAELNAAGERNEGWSAGMRLLLGGTSVQSSATFLRDLREVATNERFAA